MNETCKNSKFCNFKGSIFRHFAKSPLCKEFYNKEEISLLLQKKDNLRRLRQRERYNSQKRKVRYETKQSYSFPQEIHQSLQDTPDEKFNQFMQKLNCIQSNYAKYKDDPKFWENPDSRLEAKILDDILDLEDKALKKTLNTSCFTNENPSPDFYTLSQQNLGENNLWFLHN